MIRGVYSDSLGCDVLLSIGTGSNQSGEDEKGFSKKNARKGKVGAKIIILILSISAFIVALAQASPALGYYSDSNVDSNTVSQDNVHIIPFASSNIVIDGKLDEITWQNALKLSLDYEMNPGENIPAIVKTDAYVMYDNKNVYFGFYCHDPDISKIRAKFAERDKVWGDDVVEIDLDTYNDERRNYFFITNIRGSQEDGISSSQGGNLSWDGIWESRGTLKDDGYILEIAIPFSTLQFQRSEDEQTWGINIVRWYPRSVYHALSLIAHDRSNNSYQAQFLKIRGFKDVETGKNLEIVPTTTFGATTEKDLDSDGEETDRNGEAGITAEWGITPNINLSGTINPDFSQVEADALQLDINQPLAIFFPEKRPFFTDGSDLIGTPLNSIYTRMMENPDWGVKVAGKESDYTIGAYLVQDNSTRLIVPGVFSSRLTGLDTDNFSSIVRLKRDFGSHYTFGALVTDREGDDYYNRILSFDGRMRITDNDTITFQVAGSATKYPGQFSQDIGQAEGEFKDLAAMLEYSRSINSNSNFFVSLKDTGEGYRNDLGFNRRVDYRRIYSGYRNRWDAAPGSWWSTITVGGDLYYAQRKSTGDRLHKQALFLFNFKGKYQTDINSNITIAEINHLNHYFDVRTLNIGATFKPSARIQFKLNTNYGNRIDFVNLRPAKGLTLNPGMFLNFGGRVDVNFDHIYEKFTVEGSDLYTANISQGTLLYHFNSRSYFRAILQYLDYKNNVSNYLVDIEPRRKTFFTQLLYSYKLNPRTVLYLGYTDNYFGNQNFDLQQTDRTVFIKLGYAFSL